MSFLDRLASKAPRGDAAGLHTPEQAAYRQNIPAGRTFAADALEGTGATAWRVHRHPDGTGDLVRLDQDGTNWIQGSAKASTDFKVGRI